MRYSVTDDIEAGLQEFAHDPRWRHFIHLLEEHAAWYQQKAALEEERHLYWKGVWEGILYARGHLVDELDKLKGKSNG